MAGFENDIVFSKNADFTQSDNQSPVEANGLITNGQMWIGSTSTNAGGTHINVGNLVSLDGSILIDYASPNITISSGNIFGPDVDFQTLGNTPIFTATEGDYIIINIIFKAVNISGSPSGGSLFSFGWTAPNYDDWISATAGPPLLANGFYSLFNPTSPIAFIPNGQTFQINITGIDAGFTNNIEQVILEGFYT